MRRFSKRKRRRVTDIFVIVMIIVLYMSSRYWYYDTKEDIINVISNKTIIEEAETETQYITVLVERNEMSSDRFLNVKLDVNCILQKPELPTGCEVTSLTIVLNYLGFDIDKTTLSDIFLPKGEIGSTHPDDAFIGNPRDTNGYGANAPVLVTTANDYLSYYDTDYQAYNVSGNEFSELEKYVLDGYPVMVWETINMVDSVPTTKWTLDDEEYQWYANEHCMVLIGWTEDDYIMADPLKGIVEYDKQLVIKRYNERDKQALVIY